MRKKLLTICIATLLAGCAAAPPAPPVPDENTRRPANSSVGIELESCQANLANTKISLEESQRNAVRTGAILAQTSMHSDARPMGKAAAGGTGLILLPGNIVYVLFFAYARDEIRLSEDEVNRLVMDARSAVAIQVRGRTDATRDNAFDSALAARRVNAVFSLLVGHGVDPSKIRLTYQGQGDTISPNTDEKTRALNRRAEVEIYRAASQVVMLAGREVR